MEVTTIVGIVIAVIIMLFGLRILFKKPTDAAPSLESNLHMDKDSQQPVIPRHVRDQLHSSKAEAVARVEPTLAEVPVVTNEKLEHSEEKMTEAVGVQPTIATMPDSVEIKQQALSDQKIQDQNSKNPSVVQDGLMAAETLQAQPEKENTLPEFSLNTQIEKAEISEFDDESSILDEHLHEQQRVDEESALSTAVDFIALNIYPERRVLSGEKTLKVLLKYGLRFGEMACFHRYSQDESKLLLSVLQITDEGAAGFDLETLSTEQVKGLAFFLALPHSDVQNAFDTMDSISRLIAREIDGTVYDQNNQEFTPQLREQWRHQAIDYRSGHAAEV